MWEFMKISAFWVNIAISCAGIGVAHLWVCNWLIGQMFRQLKIHNIFIDYVFDYKKYKAWKVEQRKAR